MNSNLDSLINNIYKDTPMTEDTLGINSKILRISDCSVGEFFSGVVYVVNSRFRRNRDKETYDITFDCVDGEGKLVTMRMFSTDKKEIRNEIIFIKKGQSNYSPKFNKTFYNIQELVRYKRVLIPVSVFIKTIETIEDDRKEFLNLLSEETNEKLSNIYGTIIDKISITDLISKTPFSDSISRLGSGFKVFNNMMKHYFIISKNTGSELSLFRLTSLLYVSNIVLKSKLKFDCKSDSEAIIAEMTVVDMDLLKIIMDSDLTTTIKTLVFGILVNDRYESEFHKKFNIVKDTTLKSFEIESNDSILNIDSKLNWGR